jgi:hypothetical protein
MGILQMIEGISTVIGLLCYHWFCKDISYRRILFWTIVISFIAGLTVMLKKKKKKKKKKKN